MFSSASVISTSSTVSHVVAVARFFLAVKDVLADEKVIVGRKQDIHGTGWSIISSSVSLSLMDELLRLFWEATLTEEGACGLASGVEDAGGGSFLSACRE
jgi:hypothetical protein